MRVLCSRGNTSLGSSPVPSHHTPDVRVRAVLVDGYLKCHVQKGTGKWLLPGFAVPSHPTPETKSPESENRLGPVDHLHGDDLARLLDRLVFRTYGQPVGAGHGG